jgi:hypothetical protein
MNFHEFWVLLERERIPLFHGTTTGGDDENLKSFRAGIRPKSSEGWGQGAGYYVYSGVPSGGGWDASRARDHAVGVSKLGSTGSTGSFRKAGGVGGDPMVVKHMADLNPRDYDIDLEIESKDVAAFLRSRAEEVNRSLGGRALTMKMKDDGYSVADTKLYGVFRANNDSIGIWMTNPVGSGPTPPAWTGRIKGLQVGRDYWPYSHGDLRDASEMAELLRVLFKEVPGLERDYRSFVRAIMKRTSEGRTKPRAWKYVGSQTLRPDAIRVGRGTGWEEA